MLHLNNDTKFINPTPKFDYDKIYFPEVGMLGTEYVGSDRYAVVCLSVDSPKRVTVGKLSNIDENNIKNHPNIEIDSEGVMRLIDIYKEKVYDTEQWSLRKNGKWKEMASNYSGSIHWGIADPYRDMDF